MALVRAVSGFELHTKEDYKREKKDIFARRFNQETERIWNGMIYCRFCHEPKVADFPDRNFIVKCNCQCEVDRWKRRQKTILNPPKATATKRGDWNPFDRGVK